ncbi:hypothetical protein [Treponema pedis]|uniref:hypothetical protein n=1 Tax=Treponema pedis TaxID=409322 RepID=UPI0003F4BC12|nr:hypothetical protein [Treponema pedis]
MKNTNELIYDEFVIAVFDIDRFGQIAKGKNPKEIFDFLYEFNSIFKETVLPANPIVIIPQGDTVIAAFPKTEIDNAAAYLLKAKTLCENFIKESGYSCSVSAAVHFGEAAIGKAFKNGANSFQILGNEVNSAFLLLRIPYYGRLTISPVFFRKLNGESRKLFKKYTPPIVYTL